MTSTFSLDSIIYHTTYLDKFQEDVTKYAVDFDFSWLLQKNLRFFSAICQKFRNLAKKTWGFHNCLQIFYCNFTTNHLK